MDLEKARERFWAHGKLLRGIEEVAGIDIPDTILRHLPLGGPRGPKVLLVLRPTAERVGRILIPDSAYKEQENDGWIIAVSADCGVILSGLIEVMTADSDWRAIANAEDLLGLNVTIPRSGGTVLKVNDQDDNYRGRFMLVCEQDLLTVIGKVTPK